MHLLLVFYSVAGCSISYKFNGANINYQTTHSISIADFPNNAAMVNPNLSPKLSEGIRDLFQRQTRLQVLRKGGDLETGRRDRRIRHLSKALSRQQLCFRRAN